MISAILIAAAVAALPMTVAGPSSPLAGTFVDAGKDAPIVLIIPGSGPTDRDGNNPMGVSAAPYKLLAEALAERGISSLRADKRGMFESKAAIPDANKVTIQDYAADAHNWAGTLRKQTGAKCVWVLGHSEGGVVALSAAENPVDLCGVILVSAPGRKLGEVIREQLKSNPAAAALVEPANKALASLEAGNTVAVETLPAPLHSLFAPPVQGFLINLLSLDPTAMAAKVSLPMLIVQGGKDIQVSKGDAQALHSAQANSKLVTPPNMNHVLKDVLAEDRESNLATYANPSLPVDRDLVDAIAAFVKPKG